MFPFLEFDKELITLPPDQAVYRVLPRARKWLHAAQTIRTKSTDNLALVLRTMSDNSLKETLEGSLLILSSYAVSFARGDSLPQELLVQGRLLSDAKVLYQEIERRKLENVAVGKNPDSHAADDITVIEIPIERFEKNLTGQAFSMIPQTRALVEKEMSKRKSCPHGCPLGDALIDVETEKLESFLEAMLFFSNVLQLSVAMAIGAPTDALGNQQILFNLHSEHILLELQKREFPDVIGDTKKNMLRCKNCQKEMEIIATDRGEICTGCNELICLKCGCTNNAPCVRTDNFSLNCYWFETNLCSICAMKPEDYAN